MLLPDNLELILPGLQESWGTTCSPSPEAERVWNWLTYIQELKNLTENEKPTLFFKEYKDLETWTAAEKNP